MASKAERGMTPSRAPQSTTTGSCRRFSSSSSGVRSARRASWPTRHTARGLRTRLGTASSRTTGSTLVACGIGQMSVGKWIPQSHRGRSVIDRSPPPEAHADPPTELTSTSVRTRSGWRWASLMATPPPKLCPTTKAFSSRWTASQNPSTQSA